jgi:predicted RNA-binding Zn-ribbon protein involved in translation (DUF1610 family)
MTVEAVVRWRCDECGHYSHGATPEDAGFEKVDDAGIVVVADIFECPRCGEHHRT